mmetsp:Transcript_10347/g.21777  ORF Transcript_10347/g.21777 Transcript_10347/m.21777 type:complete len:324 (-) Transcript_10347:301-1272(-)
MKRAVESGERKAARKRARLQASERYRESVEQGGGSEEKENGAADAGEAPSGGVAESRAENGTDHQLDCKDNEEVFRRVCVVKEVPDSFKVIVVLAEANLETVKVGKDGGFQLLNQDDHHGILARTKRDPANARPDIAHQCLLSLLDSPLNKAGRLKVYVKTRKNVLIDVHPQIRIPRTFKRFAGLIVELLQKLKVRATNSPDPLLKVIRNPVTSHLPVGCRRVLMTYNCDRVENMQQHALEITKAASSLSRNHHQPQNEASDNDEIHEKAPKSVVYVVGAMAHGKVEDADWVDEELSISNYPLSGATVCSKIVQAYENTLDVL